MDIHAVAKEINGYFLADKVDPASKRAFKKGDPVPSFAFLQDDGSTSSGCWIYCNSYAEKGNMAARQGYERPLRDRALFRMGLELAGQPPDHLQRRIGRPQGQPLGPQTSRHCLGRHEMGRRRAGRRRQPRFGKTPLHHETRRRGEPFRAGFGRRTVPGALRAAGEPPGEQSPVPADEQPGHQAVGQAGCGNRYGYGTERRSPVSHRLHHHAGQRALAIGCHDAMATLAGGNAAEPFHRDQRRVGRRRGASRTGTRSS